MASGHDEEYDIRISHPKPKNHEDFEILSLKLLRAYWKCEQLERYSTPGGAQHGVDIIDLSGQDPLRAAQCKLHEEGKPITEDEIRAEVEKAKHFTPPLGLYLILTTAKGNKSIHDTVIAMNRVHRQKGLFIVQFMAWSRIEELLDQYTEVRDEYEGGLSARAATRLDTQLTNIGIQLAARTAEEKEDQFHSEIDEARDYINKSEVQMAKLLLHRLRSRHETDLKPRHKFRVLTNLAAVAIGEDDWKRAAELYLEAKVHQPDDEMAQSNEALAYQILGDRERAFALVSTLKDIYPTSERIWGIFVRNAPDTMTFDEIQSYVPPHVGMKGEAAVALAQRAMDVADLATGERFARAATVSHPNWSIPWLILGAVILDDETSRGWKTYGFGNCSGTPGC